MTVSNQGKVCKNCFEFKYYTEFRVRGKKSNGEIDYHVWCKVCKSSYDARKQLEDRLTKNPEKYLECDKCDHIFAKRYKTCTKCNVRKVRGDAVRKETYEQKVARYGSKV